MKTETMDDIVITFTSDEIIRAAARIEHLRQYFEEKNAHEDIIKDLKVVDDALAMVWCENFAEESGEWND